MILTNWPLHFRGTIKGISPEQAKRMFHYNLPPGAKGITFKPRNKKTEIVPYFPEKYVNKNPIKSPEFISSKNILTKLIKIAPQIRTTIIRPLWNNMAGKDYYSGHHMFISINHKLLLTGIENILFTIGTLNPPKTHTIELKNSTLKFQLQNSNPDYQLGIISMDSQTLQITHIQPTHYSDYEPLACLEKDCGASVVTSRLGGIIHKCNPKDKTINIPIKTDNPLVFLYYYDKNKQSYSSSVRIYPS